MKPLKASDIFKSFHFTVKIESGPDTGRSFKVFPPMFTVGRSPDCSITLNDPRVSRTQCQIEFRDEIFIVDKSRRQTTFLNGAKITQSVLKPNDLIAMGNTRLRLSMVAKQEQKAIGHLSSQSSPRSSLSGQHPSEQLASAQNIFTRPSLGTNHRLMLYGSLILIFGLVFTVLLFEEKVTPLEPVSLSHKTELKRQVEEAESRRKEDAKSFKDKHNSSAEAYQAKVSAHFIHGFRDLQSMNFDRAATSFGATLARDPAHKKAKRLRQIAQQKKQELIEKHMYYGNDYSEKLMYSRCASEFEKAMILINQPDDEKYLLAQSRRKACQAKASRGHL